MSAPLSVPPDGIVIPANDAIPLNLDRDVISLGPCAKVKTASDLYMFVRLKA